MNKIYGDEATIKKAKAAKPGDKTVYINWDAIEEIPDQYEVIVSEVKFDPSKLEESFTNVGTDAKPSWYPKADLMYSIAEARGIAGGESVYEPIFEDVEIDEMNMIQTGAMIKKKTGYIVKKKSTVLEEDGTMKPSSERHGIHNAWQDCLKIWHKEEKATEGYSKVINGEYNYFNKKVTGPHYMRVNGKYTNATPVKYMTKWDRRCHFDEELHKAMGQADTKAHLKTIREIAGLPTGFTSDDLKSGVFIFSKVRRSRESLKLEAAANLHAISTGHQNSESIDMLFGQQNQIDDQTLEPEPEQEKESPFPVKEKNVTPKTPKEKILEAIDKYNLGGSIPENLNDTTESLTNWLDDEAEPEKSEFWGKAIDILKQIEEDIPEEYRVKHELY